MARIVDMLMSRPAFILIASAQLLYFVYDVRSSILTYGTDVRCWNLPNITVTFALIPALYLARQIDARMRSALHELWLQGTLPNTADPGPTLQERILKGSTHREIFSALLMMLVMIVSYAWSAPSLRLAVATISDPLASAEMKRVILLSLFWPIAVGVLSGLVAGAFFGRLATYGSAAAVLASPDTTLNIRPGHFDGANGFRPVGDFYLYQAVLTAIPLLWLSGWALATPWYHGSQCYAHPIDPAYTLRVSLQCYGQWLVVACFTYVGFVRPVLKLRARLKRTRAELLAKRVPEIESEIVRLKTTLAGTPEEKARTSIEARIHDLAREHWAIRTMSCWPMDKATFSKYAPLEILSNVVPILVGPMLSVAQAQSGDQTMLPSELLSRFGSFLRRIFL